MDFKKFKTLDASSYDPVIEQFDYFTELVSKSFAERMISQAEIMPKEKVLDIGTGTGVVALRAAKLIDKQGTVYGVDLSEEMLAKAKEKSRLQDISDKVNFIRMDAENLTFKDKRFDVAVSLFALLHFPQPLNALTEIYRVLRPGGRLILAVGSGMPILSFQSWFNILKRLPDYFKIWQGRQLTAPDFLDSLVKRTNLADAQPEESHLADRSLNRSGDAAALIKQAGFQILGTEWHGHREIIKTPEEFWEIQRTFSSIARKRLSGLSDEEYNLLHRNFLDKCKAVQSRGGQLVYPFGAFYISARRPEIS